MSQRTKKILVVVVALVALAVAAFYSLGFQLVSPREGRVPIPAEFSYAPLASVLQHVGPDGRVDYDALMENTEALETFATQIAVIGPRSTPRAFSGEASKLAYYLNAYNALVLLGVARAWPIETVHDVRGLIEPKAGFGFFYAQHFRLDGRLINLYDLEHEVIRAFGDARIHAAINCASASCPSLSPTPFDAGTLDASLDAVSHLFAMTPHVRVAGDAVELSAIYDWYSDDFRAHATQEGWGQHALIDYVTRFADPTVATQLRLARDSELPIRFVEYDWSLNKKR